MAWQWYNYIPNWASVNSSPGCYATIDTGTEDPDYPASNLLDDDHHIPHRFTSSASGMAKWTIRNVKTGYLKDMFALYGDDLPSGCQIAIAAYSNGNTTMWLAETRGTNGIYYRDLDNGETWEHWELSITNLAANTEYTIGNIYLAAESLFSHQPSLPYDAGPARAEDVMVTPGGRKFVYENHVKMTWRITWDRSPAAYGAVARSTWETYLRTQIPFLIWDPVQRGLYLVRFAEVPDSRVVQAYQPTGGGGAGKLYSVAWNLEEEI